MDIRQARHIAKCVETVPADDIRFFQSDFRAAFARLDRAASDEQNPSKTEDRRLAQVLWDSAGVAP